jgi:hypothetical protein
LSRIATLPPPSLSPIIPAVVITSSAYNSLAATVVNRGIANLTLRDEILVQLIRFVSVFLVFVYYYCFYYCYFDLDKLEFVVISMFVIDLGNYSIYVFYIFHHRLHWVIFNLIYINLEKSLRNLFLNSWLSNQILF